MCSTKKILKPTLFCFLFFIHNLSFAQSDSLTELQWKQYARAHYAAASVNREALKQALNNEYGHVVDSLAMLDIFSPLVYKGLTLRAGMDKYVLNGIQKYFFPSGKVCAEINYKNNKLHGTSKFFYSSGQLWKISNYIEDKASGRQVIFFPSGKVYKSNVWQDGISITDTSYYQDGKIYFIAKRKNKIIKETFKDEYYSIDEHKVMQSEYEMEEEDDYRFFNPQGKEISMTAAEKLFGNDKDYPEFEIESALSSARSDHNLSDSLILDKYLKGRNSIQRCFYSPIIQDTLHNACQILMSEDGKYLSPFPNAVFSDSLFCPLTGTLLRVSKLSRGKLNGELKYYYHSGNPLSEYHFIDDVKEGRHIEYYENGNLKERGNFKNGVPVDTTLIFSENGLLKSRTIYTADGVTTTSVFWEDGKSLQRLIITQPKQFTIRQFGGSTDNRDDVKISKIVRPRQPSSTAYFDKEGNEISSSAFQKKYPGILPKSKAVRF